ncbi:MAG: carbamoyl-phosphate synthase large subunit, partial [Lachnospiraceae bacterium]|nr:carbamoyl-phosphate synthase large subunit [Lachnospiraceae bacterium]
MKTALVTSVGSVASDIVIKTLKKYDFRLVGCDIYAKELVVDANNVNVFYKAPYVHQTEKYFDFIKGIC